ncbi:OPT oligopeptide transporter protein-domain-containing protein [Phakopsora pachyrhizi]|uniref:OPT oligopeptide transporter protein-domain-containing protein n=1 Tax=Phakopsora pachyrhizi TaxID=170000 RepID=A0AAV0BUS0_PHAPC|nr:OPT oligopeptide transporter protein-domain-containing protein [Phakopsora pachyrhizi]CAH7690064.1 OPT oligopeptide transporter protein-domain-containing protein [Phakopsora pachyrhizi]
MDHYPEKQLDEISLSFSRSDFVEGEKYDGLSLNTPGFPGNQRSNGQNAGAEDIPLDDDPLMPATTFRALLIGIFVSSIVAVIQQFFLFKPARSQVQPLFIQIVCLFLGRALEKIPGPGWWNPGPYTRKENTLSAIMATAASVGTLAVKMIASQELYDKRPFHFTTSMSIMMSSQFIGYGFAGILRGPFVYARQAVFPAILPSVAFIHSFHDHNKKTKDQIKFFKKGFYLISLYEILPQYLAPTLQAVSPFCLAWQNNEFIARQFGGVLSHQGLGMFSFSLEWNSISSLGPLYTPFSAQINQWFGILLGYILYNLAWEKSWWSGGKQNGFPFLNSQIFTKEGKLYNTSTIIDEEGKGNLARIKAFGAPYLASSFVLSNIATHLSVGAAISHCVLWGWNDIWSKISRGRKLGKKDVDPHQIICLSYKEVSMWVYLAMMYIAISLALLASLFSESGLPTIGLAVALVFAGILVIASAHLKSTTGVNLEVEPVIQMLGGMIFPNDSLGNMWFTTYGSASVSQSISMLQDLKLGQYMHLPPISVLTFQTIGTVVGVLFNYIVMSLVVGTNRDLLLSEFGSDVFTGVALEDFHSLATIWGLFTNQLFSAKGRYFIVPLSLCIGLLLPLPFFLLRKSFPKMKQVHIALVCESLASILCRANSGFTLSALAGFLSQFVAKRYYSNWFHKYNYVLSAALDGGAQVTAVLLGFAVEGGAGWKRVKIPQHPLNPATYPYTNRAPDYCMLIEKKIL